MKIRKFYLIELAFLSLVKDSTGLSLDSVYPGVRNFGIRGCTANCVLLSVIASTY